MSILTQPISFANGIGVDAAYRLRISEESRLFDGKVLNGDDPYLFDDKGTGTGTYENNTYGMAVTAGQYFVRQSKIYTNYSPGKSHIIEFTWEDFQCTPGVTKEIGYISSSNAAPYSSDLDGIRIYNDGSTHYLQSYNNGVATSNIPFAQWDNYELLKNYDWSNFGIGLTDFLWLGGKGYRFFMKTDDGFVLAHEYKHAGNYPTLICQSPNKPIRYAIRSSSGSCHLRYVCSQISTEGSIVDSGKTGAMNSGYTPITLPAVGTTYPIISMRKKSTHRDIAIKLVDFALRIASNDEILWTVQKAPTLSEELTYEDYPNSSLQRALGDGTITVTNPGRELISGSVNQNLSTPSGALKEDIYSFLGVGIDDTMDEIILCGTPITANITTYGSLIYKEF